MIYTLVICLLFELHEFFCLFLFFFLFPINISFHSLYCKTWPLSHHLQKLNYHRFVTYDPVNVKRKSWCWNSFIFCWNNLFSYFLLVLLISFAAWGSSQLQQLYAYLWCFLLITTAKACRKRKKKIQEKESPLKCSPSQILKLLQNGKIHRRIFWLWDINPYLSTSFIFLSFIIII